MNNYKDTGRVYTLQDLFDLGLKLEVGDSYLHPKGGERYIGGVAFAEIINEPAKSDNTRFLISSKQLDEHLEKQAMNEIKHTAQEDEVFEAMGKSVEWDGKGRPPVGCVCEYYDNKHSDAWIKVIVNYSSEWGVVVESIDVAKGTELFFNFFEGKKFRKLETSEQKANRERLEAAYDLYTHTQNSMDQPSHNFDWFTSPNMVNVRIMFLIIVDKTGYKVASND